MVQPAKAYSLFNLVLICGYLMTTLFHTYDKLYINNECKFFNMNYINSIGHQAAERNVNGFKYLSLIGLFYTT